MNSTTFLKSRRRRCGFTLIEVLTALVIMSLLALMSYRGLSSVIDARDHVAQESDKWRHVASFFARFESDVELAMPVAAATDGDAPVWIGQPGSGLSFSRFAAGDDMGGARRLAYRLNAKREIELWLWPATNTTAAAARYPLLDGVNGLDIAYMGDDAAWIDTWPKAEGSRALPRAVRVTITLATGEQIMRVFALQS